MKVQTFTAASVKEALGKVREALGPEAMILETRQNNDVAYPRVEISAAIVPAGASTPKPLFSKPKPIANAYGPAAYARQRDDAKEEPEPGDRPKPSVAIDGELKALRREIRRVAELHIPQVDPIEQALQTFGSSFARGLEETRDLLRALLAETRAQAGMDFAPAEARLYSLLTFNGVEDLLAEELVRGLEWDGEEAPTPLALRGLLAERLLARVRIAPPLATRRGRQVVGFFGPTGVGKTTSIAKIAADASIRYGRKVGLITTDTYRIAAVEQLAAYADILELPLEVAAGSAELTKKLKALRSCDMILVDTAGRNPKDDDAIRQLADDLEPGAVATRMLCLAAGTSPRTLAEVLRAFKPVAVGELVITKMDECVGHGSILNAHLRTGLPLTYFATGQRVPEDFEPASAERLVRLVLEQWVIG